jgi:hypothetical protein
MLKTPWRNLSTTKSTLLLFSLAEGEGTEVIAPTKIKGVRATCLPLHLRYKLTSYRVLIECCMDPTRLERNNSSFEGKGWKQLSLTSSQL